MDERRIINGRKNTNNLIFYYGPMGCGKTRDVSKLLHSKKEDGFYPVLMKPQEDIKGNDFILSRDGSKFQVDILIDKKMNIYDIISNYIKENLIDCIVVDEVQFLSPKQVEQLSLIVDCLGIDVYCYGLLTDFKTNMFDASKRLIEIADYKIEIERQCTCGRKRIFNLRIDAEGNRIIAGNQISIDGQDEDIEYYSFCRQCTNNLTKRTNAAKKLTLDKNKKSSN